MSVTPTALGIGVKRVLSTFILDGVFDQYKGDYGAAWAFLPNTQMDSLKKSFDLVGVILHNTNGAGSTRLYVWSSLVGSWKYVALT